MNANIKDPALTRLNYAWLWAVFLILVIVGCLSRVYFGVFVRDQAELVALSQQYGLIYDEQMPLLAWLMTGLFRATDYFILWPDIYKFTCLGLCLFSIFRLSFHITNESRVALVAALSLFFLPTFHEDMLGELTHSAALLAATAMSTDWLVRQSPERLVKTRALLILILIWLFGFLAKHTMGLIILAQLAAYFIAFKPPRAAKGRLIAAAIITFIMILPAYVALASQSATFGQGLEEFYADEGFARGLVDLLTSILTEAAVFILLGGIGYLAARAKRKSIARIFQNKQTLFLGLTMLISILLFVPFIIIADIAVVRDRWLAPALMLLAPVFAIFIASTKIMRPKTLQALLIGFVCALGIFRASEPYIDSLMGHQNIDNAPIAAMSKDLRETHPDISTYVSPNYNLIATLKYQDPKLRIFTQKNIQHLQRADTASSAFILLSLARDPPLNAPHLAYECGPKREETRLNWTYFYETCVILPSPTAGNP